MNRAKSNGHAPPYVGLRPYTESHDDRERFFGRDADEEIIISNLYATSLTVLYGASGVGKSSVLMAGVLPKLRETPHFASVVFREWQTGALLPRLKSAVLAAVVEAAGRPIDVDATRPLDEFLQSCAAQSRGHLVLIFDQFEEYFLYHPPSGISDGFDAEFARSVNRLDTDTSFLLSIREDSLSRLDRFQGRIPNLLRNLLRLDHLDRDGAERAIREPLVAYNRLQGADKPAATVDADLVQALIDQVSSGQVAIDQSTRGLGRGRPVEIQEARHVEAPLLQMVLTRLWDEAVKVSPPRLNLATLQRLGGAAKIVRTHLDQTMRKFRRRQRRLAADVFQFLVTPSGSKIAFTAADLGASVKVKEARIGPLLEKLSQSGIRLLRPVPPPPGDSGGARYEIFHDVLAGAVLAWRRRHLAWRRFWRILRRTLGVFTAMYVVAAFLGVRELDQRWESRQREWRANDLRLAAESEKQKALSEKQRALSVIYRQDLAVPFLVRVLREHEDRILDVAVSPDGNRIVTASNDGSALVWDRASGAILARLSPENDAGIGIARFTSDGTRVVTIGGDQSVYVWDAASGTRIHVFHQEGVDGVNLDVSRTGLLAWAGSDGAIRLCDPISGQEMRLIDVDSRVHQVAFDSSGTHVLAVCEDRVVRIWDAGTGELRCQPLAHPASIYTAVFSPDGSRVLTSCLDKVARLWDVATGKLVRKYPGHDDVVLQAVFSPGGDLIATGSADRTARVWAIDAAEPRFVLRGHMSYVWHVAFSPDGLRFATGGDDNTVRLWRVKDGRCDAVLQGHTADITKIAFTPDSSELISVSNDATARIWTGQPVRPTHTLEHRAEVYWASWSPDGRAVVTASSDRTARIWDVKSGVCRATLAGHEREVVAAEFNPDGALIATASRDKRAGLWDARSGRLVRWLDGHSDWVSNLAFSPDGRFVATVGWDRVAILHALPTGEAKRLEGHSASLTTIAFSHDGENVVTGDENGEARVWDVDTGRSQRVLAGRHRQILNAVEFSPDDESVLTVSGDPYAYLWAIRSATSTIRLGDRPRFQLTVGRFSPDGDRVALGSRNFEAIIWDILLDTVIQRFEHTDTVLSLDFSPDGALVATASGDGTACVWEVDSGRRLVQLRGHQGEVNCARFSPDGRLLVTAGTDHTARIWTLPLP